jgi:TonB family protein
MDFEFIASPRSRVVVRRCSQSGLVASLLFHVALGGAVFAYDVFVGFAVRTLGRPRVVTISAAFADAIPTVETPEIRIDPALPTISSQSEMALKQGSTMIEPDSPADAEEQKRGDEARGSEIVVSPGESWQDERHFVSSPTNSPSSRAEAATPDPELTADAVGETPLGRVAELVDAAEVVEMPAEGSGATTATKRDANAPSVASSAAAVDFPPSKLRFVGRPCRYPEVAIQSGWEGEVVLSIVMRDDGSISLVTVHKSSGNPVFDAEAVNTARSWRAVSDLPGGKLWATHVLKPIIFRIPR